MRALSWIVLPLLLAAPAALAAGSCPRPRMNTLPGSVVSGQANSTFG